MIKVYGDGDLRVEQADGTAWTLNPKCVKLERGPTSLAAATERSNLKMDLSHQRDDHVMTPLSGLSGTSSADKLVREAAQGRFEYVKHYLDTHRDQVDCMSAGKTCLQVAAHQGHLQIVMYLLSLKANVNLVDKEGDSTLHYAAFGNQPEIMKVLLLNGADINVLNSSHCSALHISAHKKPPHCVRILLEFGADVNIQDSYGDTALHDAIGKENSDVVELLCNAPNLDLTVRNNRGFNALHHASLKGNVAATRRILQLAPQLVDIKKDDGFAPLHLAALNGHSAVAELLVRDGKADINIRNNRRQTPFLLSVSQGHTSAIEKLVNLGCDILVKDEDGDNAMHLCVIKKSNLTQDVHQNDAPKIYEIHQTLTQCQENRLMYTILCYLAQNGCQIDNNNKGNKITHWILNKDMQELILSYVNKANGVQPPLRSNSRVGEPSGSETPDQIYSNIQSLNLSDSGSGLESASTSSAGASTSAAGASTSNPPTPMRRNRDLGNASPSVDEITVVNQNIPKKINTEANSNNKPVPTSSTGESSTAADANKPNIPKDSHISRKDLNNQLGRGAVSAVPNKIINKMQQINECIVCNELMTLIIFEPCGHQIACSECSVRMKKCLSCSTVIERRVGAELSAAASIAAAGLLNEDSIVTRQPSADRLRYLESKILEIEETHCCSICMERRRNVAFLCGHGACSKCAETLKTCHMCRKTIVKKINLY